MSVCQCFQPDIYIYTHIYIYISCILIYIYIYICITYVVLKVRCIMQNAYSIQLQLAEEFVIASTHSSTVDLQTRPQCERTQSLKAGRSSSHEASGKKQTINSINRVRSDSGKPDRQHAATKPVLKAKCRTAVLQVNKNAPSVDASWQTAPLKTASE